MNLQRYFTSLRWSNASLVSLLSTVKMRSRSLTDIGPCKSLRIFICSSRAPINFLIGGLLASG